MDYNRLLRNHHPMVYTIELKVLPFCSQGLSKHSISDLQNVLIRRVLLSRVSMHLADSLFLPVTREAPWWEVGVLISTWTSIQSPAKPHFMHFMFALYVLAFISHRVHQCQCNSTRPLARAGCGVGTGDHALNENAHMLTAVVEVIREVWCRTTEGEHTSIMHYHSGCCGGGEAVDLGFAQTTPRQIYVSIPAFLEYMYTTSAYLYDIPNYSISASLPGDIYSLRGLDHPSNHASADPVDDSSSDHGLLDDSLDLLDTDAAVPDAPAIGTLRFFALLFGRKIDDDVPGPLVSSEMGASGDGRLDGFFPKDASELCGEGWEIGTTAGVARVVGAYEDGRGPDTAEEEVVVVVDIGRCC